MILKETKKNKKFKQINQHLMIKLKSNGQQVPYLNKPKLFPKIQKLQYKKKKILNKIKVHNQLM